MISKKFLQAGHFPTLMAAFLYFDVSFMVWVLLGPLAPFLGEQMHLTATQKGLLTAIPLLGGSLFRPILGVLGDRLGGRKTGLLGLGLTLLPLLLGWRFAHTPGQFFFHDQYGLAKVRAGDFTTLVVLAGSFLRPIGGWLSDKIGGYRLLLVLLSCLSVPLFAVGNLLPLPAEVALLFFTMGMLGMGN